MISANVITDSISPLGIRLTTMQLCYPRFILAEFNTHRVFSRNSSSSRAIPVKKMIEQVTVNPAKPVWWGKNQPGMQAREELDYFPPVITREFDGHRYDKVTQYSPREKAQQIWEAAAENAANFARQLDTLGAHKQIVNRILEPWQWMQTIVTATEWDNFYALRRHPDAQPEFKALADAMWDAMNASTPKLLQVGQWHLPYVDDASIVFGGGLASTVDELKKWSTARCARVSYLNHDKSDPSPEKDVGLHDQLKESGHFSPFEHQATPMTEDKMFSNFKGWKSYRFELGF